MTAEDRKKIGVIVMAIVVGLVAAVLTANHIQKEIENKTTNLAKEYEEKSIKPLMDRFEELERQNRKLQQDRSFSSKDAQPVVAAPSLPASSLAAKTPEGKRAITIDIDALAAVGGLFNPGDRVDILAHLDVPKGTSAQAQKEKVTAMLFQNIEILAVGTNISMPGGYEAQQRARSLRVTLAMDPEEAGLIAFSEKNGTLQFILRSPSETQYHMLQAANWFTLADYVLERQGTDISPPKVQATVESGGGEAKPYIQIFRGGREL